MQTGQFRQDSLSKETGNFDERNREIKPQNRDSLCVTHVRPLELGCFANPLFDWARPRSEQRLADSGPVMKGPHGDVGDVRNLKDALDHIPNTAAELSGESQGTMDMRPYRDLTVKRSKLAMLTIVFVWRECPWSLSELFADLPTDVSQSDP